MHCPNCESDIYVKNGFMKGKQRYLCKRCGCNFTQSEPRGKDGKLKVVALIYKRCGFNISQVASIIDVSATTIMNWRKKYDRFLNFPEAEEDGYVYLYPDILWEEIYNQSDSSKL